VILTFSLPILWGYAVVSRLKVGNAFVARRINYEYDFFKDVAKGPVFLTIMVIITCLQVIIMQTPIGYIFKVMPTVHHRSAKTITYVSWYTWVSLFIARSQSLS
jgi:hypothetical protein